MRESRLIISLDFELFWGVSDVLSLKSYGQNINGVHSAIPRILRSFKDHNVKATWATVGMLMCKHYAEWKARFPIEKLCYKHTSLSNYDLDFLVKNHPKMFFASDLVKMIIDDSHELASHTYSHIYLNDQGVSCVDIKNDINLQIDVFSKFALKPRSLVFPRNYHSDLYLDIASQFGITCFRGTQSGWLHNKGHNAPLGRIGRLLRYMDSYAIPFGLNAVDPELHHTNLVRLPASIFLRPHINDILDNMHLLKIMRLMTLAAERGQDVHIWWHPHNYGADIDRNIANLNRILKHYVRLRDDYGMKSVTMFDRVVEFFRD